MDRNFSGLQKAGSEEVCAKMIYILEDDDSIRKLVTYALESQGYTAEGYDRPSAFYEGLQRQIPDLLLLDIMLPEEDGISILKKLRADPETVSLPVIMLTARSTEIDHVEGLDAGADDYVAKPFGMMELLARVRALLRRSEALSAAATGREKGTGYRHTSPVSSPVRRMDASVREKEDGDGYTSPVRRTDASVREKGDGDGYTSPVWRTDASGDGKGNRGEDTAQTVSAAGEKDGRKENRTLAGSGRNGLQEDSAPGGSRAGEQVLRFGRLRVYPRKYEVFEGEEEIGLTNKEYQLLLLLVRNEGIVLTREVLLDRIWDLGKEPENRTLDVHIRKLRAKLGRSGNCIETVRSVGYRFRAPVEARLAEKEAFPAHMESDK